MYSAYKKLMCLLLFLLSGIGSGMAQTSFEQFGQRRVQFTPFSWNTVETSNFSIHYSTGGFPLAKFVMNDAERNLAEIRNTLQYIYNGKIELLVFGDISDYVQSNLGFVPDDVNYNTGGTTRVIGNKIMVYFDGDHQHLDQQIREGIARIMMQNVLFGSNVQEVVQNALLFDLPDWYVDGIVKYTACNWTVDDDNRLRDLFNREVIHSFWDLLAMDPTFLGKSFWYYVKENYDASTMGNLLYITRINRSMESGFLFVLNKDSKATYQDWFNYFEKRFKDSTPRKRPAEKNRVTVKTSAKETRSIAKLSSAGDYIAFLTRYNGRYRLYVQAVEKDKIKLLQKGLPNSMLPQDAYNPVFSWDAGGKTLYCFYQYNKKYYILSYDTEKKKKVIVQSNAFSKIIDVQPGIDKSTLLVTAVKTAYSDIYLYNPQTGKINTITDDLWDDKNPAYVNLNGKRGIVFASNRANDSIRKRPQDTTLQIAHYDIFFYDLSKKSLTRVTNTPMYQETQPIQYTKRLIAYLSDKNGISNRYLAYRDSIFVRTDSIVYFKDSIVTNPRYTPYDSLIYLPNTLVDSIQTLAIYKDTFISVPYTNYSYNIEAQDGQYKGKFVLESLLEKGNPVYFRIPLRDSMTIKDREPLSLTPFRKKSLLPAEKKELIGYEEEDVKSINVAPLPYDSTLHNGKVDAIFQSEFVMPWENNAFLRSDSVSKLPKKARVEASKSTPYRLHLYTSNVFSRVDRGTLFNHVYQPFFGTPSFQLPSLTLWTGIDMKDVLEDYQWSAAINTASSFNNLKFYLRFYDLHKRWDKRYTFYKQSQSNVNFISTLLGIDDNPYKIRYQSNYLEAVFTYPFDEFRHFNAYTALRHDRYDYLSTMPQTLNAKAEKETWGILRAELVQDNTRNPGLNIYKGLRGKVFVEFQQLAQDRSHYFGFVGCDIRHYYPIWKNIIWANRFASSASFGKDKMLYYLGGVDAWWLGGGTKFNSSNPVNNASAYAFQTLATNLRGFSYNARNGSNYAVINSEIRFPLFSSFRKIPIKNNWAKNFQLIFFGDVGSAWVGPSPLSDQAKLSFTDKIVREPVTVEVNYFRNPIIGGYGWGMRTTWFGYYVRLDFARGVENGKVLPRMTYISLSTDF